MRAWSDGLLTVRVVRPWFVGAITLGLLLLIRLEPVPALAVAAVATALTFAWLPVSADVGAAHAWPVATTDERDGTRLEVATLSWSFLPRADGQVSERAVRRLRGVAEHRLARHGVHLRGGFAAVGRGDVDPAVVARGRELIGERPWALLAGRGGWMPTVRDVLTCIEALERLGPDRVIDERQRT